MFIVLKFNRINSNSGVSVEELAEHFQRKPGAIHSRIKKLGL